MKEVEAIVHRTVGCNLHGQQPDVGAFPRGFVYGRPAPPGFVRSPFARLAYHPSGAHDWWTGGEIEVAVLGSCVPVDASDDGYPARHLGMALVRGELAFFDALDRLCGRHAVFFRSGLRIGILADATGCRTIFFDEAGTAASHVGLLGEHGRTSLPYKFGYPGRGTPFQGVRLLGSNVLLDPSTGTLRRFWPRAPLVSIEPEAAAEIAEKAVACAMRNMSARAPLALGITAGLDSRALAAIARRNGIALTGFTYTDGRARTRVDAEVGALVCERLGFRHLRIAEAPRGEELKQLLAVATYYRHDWDCVAPLRSLLPGHILLSGSLGELGRLWYRDHKLVGRSLGTAGDLARQYRANLGSKRMAKRIKRYGTRRYERAIASAFDRFEEEGSFRAATRHVDVRDLFYWEHRMAAWHSLVLLERDFCGEPMVPFNARLTLSALMGPDPAQRAQSAVLCKLAAMPELADIPLNAGIATPAEAEASLPPSGEPKLPLAQPFPRSPFWSRWLGRRSGV